MRWVIKISVFSGILLLFKFVSAEFEKEEIYKGCGSSGGKSKKCFGDEETCIQNKNCTFLVTAFENTTHFIAEIQNNCNTESKNVFFGVGVHALVKEEKSQTPIYNCRPKFGDFKFVILWENKKCPKPGVIQKKWGYMLKSVGGPCETSPGVTDLLDFVKKRMLVKFGDIPTSLIERKQYIVKDNGTFFTNAANIIDVSHVTIITTIFLISSIST